MIYVISDTHFGHRKLDEYRKPNFETGILKRWNKTVNPSDTVIHCGDFILGRHQRRSFTGSLRFWRKQLNGKIILIRGNHDSKSCLWYMNNGFDFCADKVEMIVQGKRVVFTHRPIKVAKDELNIHGHVHSYKREVEAEAEIDAKKGYHFNATIEHMGYTPKLLNSIVSEHHLYSPERGGRGGVQ